MKDKRISRPDQFLEILKTVSLGFIYILKLRVNTFQIVTCSALAGVGCLYLCVIYDPATAKAPDHCHTCTPSSGKDWAGKIRRIKYWETTVFQWPLFDRI